MKHKYSVTRKQRKLFSFHYISVYIFSFVEMFLIVDFLYKNTLSISNVDFLVRHFFDTLYVARDVVF